jgi:preprotein translocase subunit SecD
VVRHVAQARLSIAARRGKRFTHGVRAETRSAVQAAMACGVVAALAIGVIRGRDAEPAQRGYRLMFGIDLFDVPRQEADWIRDNAAEVIRDRIRGTGIVSGAAFVQNEVLVVEISGVSGAEAERAVALIARKTELEFAIVDSTPLNLIVSAPDDPAAKSGGVTMEADTWVPDSGGRRDDFYLRASSRIALEDYVEQAQDRNPTWRFSADRAFGYERVMPRDGGPPYWRTYVLDLTQRLDGRSITAASVARDPMTDAPQVLVEFDVAGKEALADLTSRNVGSKLAIILDGTITSAPVINDAIPGGKVSVSMSAGDTRAQEREAAALVAALRTGSLPGPLRHLGTAAFSRGTGAGFLSRSWMFFALAFVLLTALVAWRVKAPSR